MSGGNSARFQQLLQQLSIAVQQKDPAVLGKILALLKKAPREPNLLHLAGLANLVSGDHQQAINYFRRSLQSHAQQPELLNNLANAYKALGDLGAAEKHYRQALELLPHYLDAWKNLGLLMTQLTQYPEAEHAFNQVLEKAPEDVAALTSMGTVRREQSRFDEAAAYYQRALDIEPNHVIALHNLGRCYKDLEQPKQAIALYQRAQLLAPELGEIELNYGNALFELGDYTKAEAHYLRAVEKSPLLVSGHETLSEFYWQLGHHDKIEKSYHTALDAAPDHLELRLSLLNLLIACGRFESAKSITEDALRLQVRPELLKIQGILYAGELNYSSAQESYEQALDHAFTLDTAQNLIKLLIHTGDYPKAQRLLDKAQAIRPEDQLNWALRGLCWRLTEDPRYHWLIDYDKHIQTFTLATPRGYSSLHEFLEELEHVLLGMHSTKFAPSQQTLKHGTQTPGRLLHKKHPVIQLYKSLLAEIVHRYIEQMPEDNEHPLLRRKSPSFEFSGSWSVKLGGGGFHVNHVHPAGWISSACYISMPVLPPTERNMDACIKFGESGLGLGDREVVERTIRPRAGQLVLFPSYTWHGTYSFACEPSEYRMTAPFDITPLPRLTGTEVFASP
jgi:tetratricopeptide (TPR) repeat protein